MARTRLAEWLGKIASDDSTAADVDSYDDYALLLDAVRGIRWPARSAVRGGIPGAHTSRLREFLRNSPSIGRIGRATIRGE